ncbi:hypothetical protein JTE90_001917 [Oedothorax gibbosus]|uniref:Uncharacterized protein n=1 Tax=Oedothorax gibbosus TaxID=931172 RepID=A0AAV6VTS5_9ARAC|nr:hypothetical protein JTE90_001917 [Oedothorax gibbosus]
MVSNRSITKKLAKISSRKRKSTWTHSRSIVDIDKLNWMFHKMNISGSKNEILQNPMKETTSNIFKDNLFSEEEVMETENGATIGSIHTQASNSARKYEGIQNARMSKSNYDFLQHPNNVTNNTLMDIFFGIEYQGSTSFEDDSLEKGDRVTIIHTRRYATNRMENDLSTNTSSELILLRKESMDID